MMFFNYLCNHSAVAAGATDQQLIKIEADSDFVVVGMLMSANIAPNNVFRSRSNLVGTTLTGAAVNGIGNAPTPNFESVDLANQVKLYRDGQPNLADVSGPGLHNLLLQLTINDKQLQNFPVRADLLTGEPGKIFLLPKPLLIQANSTIQVGLTNNMPTPTNDGTGDALRGLRGNSAGTAAPSISAQFVLHGYKQARQRN